MMDNSLLRGFILGISLTFFGCGNGEGKHTNVSILESRSLLRHDRSRGIEILDEFES